MRATRHFTLELPDGRALKCFVCGGDNLFQLGYIHDTATNAVFMLCRAPCALTSNYVLDTLLPERGSWEPVLTEQKIRPFILQVSKKNVTRLISILSKPI